MVSQFMGNFRKERLTVRENVCPRFLLVKCVTEWRSRPDLKRSPSKPEKKETRPGELPPGPSSTIFLTRLFLAGVVGQFLGTNHLSVQCAGDERLALCFAGLGIGDGDTIDFERAPDGPLVVGLGFSEVGESAKFPALRVDEIALRLNDEVNGGSAELIPFLLGVKSLLLQFARLAGSIDLGAILRKGDVGVSDVEHGGVLHLLQLPFEPTFRKDAALMLRLRQAVAAGVLPLYGYL